MIRPSIKTYREDRHDHWIDSERHRKHFLGRHSPSVHLPGDKSAVPAAVNIRREGELLKLEVSMPGFTKEEIEIAIEGNLLTVVGEKTQEASKSDPEGYLMREFAVDRVYRSFEVAEPLLREDIEAVYENGILRITFTDVPPAEEHTKKRVAIS